MILINFFFFSIIKCIYIYFFCFWVSVDVKKNKAASRVRFPVFMPEIANKRELTGCICQVKVVLSRAAWNFYRAEGRRRFLVLNLWRQWKIFRASYVAYRVFFWVCILYTIQKSRWCYSNLRVRCMKSIQCCVYKKKYKKKVDPLTTVCLRGCGESEWSEAGGGGGSTPSGLATSKTTLSWVAFKVATASSCVTFSKFLSPCKQINKSKIIITSLFRFK